MLYWVDILACRLHRFHPASVTRTTWTFAEEISALAERAAAPGLIVTLRRGFALFDPAADREPRYLHQPEAALPGNRFNDGKCDAQGRFWAGTMDFACEAPTGALYRYDPDGRCTHHDQGFAVTNGPTWSADGRSLYFNDTVNGRIYAYDFDAARGTLSNKRLWDSFAPDDGVPDGMSTDAAGRLWIAHWGGSCVSCHDPVTAHELCRVMLPTRHVTNCAFGRPTCARSSSPRPGAASRPSSSPPNRSQVGCSRSPSTARACPPACSAADARAASSTHERHP